MKRILLVLCLYCGILSADGFTSSSNNFEIGKWKEFIGVNVGAGLYDMTYGFVFNANARLAGANPITSAIGGNIAITMGKQKYTYEKVGWRYVFEIRADYMDHFKTYVNENFNLSWGWGLNISTAVDGMFDFVRENNSSFGMILGINLGLLGFNYFNTPNNTKAGLGGYVGLETDIRIGFKGQFNHSVIDFILTIPTAGFFKYGYFGDGGLKYSPVNSTLTLGYKYLF